MHKQQEIGHLKNYLIIMICYLNNKVPLYQQSFVNNMSSCFIILYRNIYNHIPENIVFIQKPIFQKI